MFEKKYGVATANGTHIVIPIVKAGVVDFAVAADWTPATGDVLITKDDGTPANINTLPNYVTNQGWEFIFTATELTAGKIDVLIVDQTATKVIEDQFFSIGTQALVPNLSGYVNGFVYCDSSFGSAGTVLGVNGTFDNPVLTLADAKTLADQMGRKIMAGGTFNNITESFTNYTLKSEQRDTAIDGSNSTKMNLNDCNIIGMKVTGGIACNEGTKWYNCIIEFIDVQAASSDAYDGVSWNCQYGGNINIATAASIHIYDGFDSTNLDLVDFRFVLASSSNCSLNLKGWKGEVKVNNMNDGNHNLRIFSDGGTKVTLNSANTTGVIELAGVANLVDNTSLSTITILDGIKNYEDKAIYFDSSASNTGTIFGKDGTVDNPVSDWTSASSLATTLGSKNIIVAGTLVITSDAKSYLFTAKISTANAATVNSQLTINAAVNFLGCSVEELSVQTDNTTVVDNDNKYLRCHIFTASTQLGGVYRDCRFNTNTYDIQVETSIIGGSGDTLGAGITFKVETATDRFIVSNLAMRLITLQDITTSNIITLINSGRDLTLDSSCTGGTLHVVGDSKITDNSATTTINKTGNGLLNWSGQDVIGAGANMIELDGADTRWTQQALEQAPPGISDWSSVEKENIRQALGVDGTKTAGGVDGDVQDTETLVTGVKAKTDNLPHSIKKATALNDFPIQMFDTTGNPLGSTVVTVQLMKDGVAYLNSTNTPATFVSDGTYKLNLSVADLTADAIMLKATAIGAAPTYIALLTEAV